MSPKKILVILNDAHSFPLIKTSGEDAGKKIEQDSGFFLADDKKLASFAGVFIPGGHAPLSDLGADKELGRILLHFHDRQKSTAAICHGPYAFLSTQQSGDGSFAYKGYKITSWSDAEEKVMETMLGGELPKVESALKDAGAEMVEGVKEKAGFINVDREVVSGGNPLAANSLGDQLLKMLA
ncbi:hypothetical protein S7711_05833 [Stachybotrys chartarum IBT 7711]|uniref:D-lactate dehydratase n=1 Tax=Stachybotrys chartarum (strain CBS 109288 / IBT 7711) TaxID=1280523 RepID=A0A084AM70_STACB|nr:hypothetical protein S7711_05833 [Stachybotrys chartarum IBT 7711]